MTVLRTTTQVALGPTRVEVVRYCDCGKEAVTTCGSSGTILGLVLCGKPVCRHDSDERGWCAPHRHAQGTMGYPRWLPQVATWSGIAPDGPGPWAWLKARWQTLTFTPERAAHAAWADVRKQFDARCPLPPLLLRVNGREFFCNEDGSVQEARICTAIEGYQFCRGLLPCLKHPKGEA